MERRMIDFVLVGGTVAAVAALFSPRGGSSESADARGLIARVDALEAESRVPIGAVIDWHRFDPDTPIPSGFEICDGRPIARGPFAGRATPNLVDRFVMGVPPERLAEEGGRNVVSLDHTHEFSATSGGTGFPSHPDGREGLGWTRLTGGDIAVPHRFTEHQHAVAGKTGLAVVPEGAPGLAKHDQRPAYLGLIKLVRVE